MGEEYERGMKEGKKIMAAQILKILFPSMGKEIADAILDGIEKGQSNQEIFHRIAHIQGEVGRS